MNRHDSVDQRLLLVSGSRFFHRRSDRTAEMDPPLQSSAWHQRASAGQETRSGNSSFIIIPKQSYISKVLQQAAGVALLNQTLVAVPSIAVAFYLIEWSGHVDPVQHLPTFGKVLFNFAVFYLLYEFGFYYTHR